MVAEADHYDQVIFFGGDSDFEPLLKYLRDNGKTSCVLEENSLPLLN